MTAPTTTAPEKMRRVVVSSGSIDVRQVTTPRPGPREALVRALAVGLCGSDTHAAIGQHPFIDLPYAPGHEVIGVVAEVGPQVRDLQVGQRVVVEPTIPCGRCKQCRRDMTNLCERMRFFGTAYDQGGMADYFTLPADRLHVIPEGMSLRTATLIEPLSTPVHAVHLAGGVRDRAVVILGAGSIGLMLLRVARIDGARRIVVTDPVPAKRARALDLGADVVLDARADDVVDQARAALGESADVVFDCVAITATLGQAVAMASKGGTVVVVGVPPSPAEVPLPVLQDHQVRLQGSAMFLPEDFARATELLGSGQVSATDLITAEVPLDRVADAYAMASSGEHTKVLLVVDEHALDEVSA